MCISEELRFTVTNFSLETFSLLASCKVDFRRLNNGLMANFFLKAERVKRRYLHSIYSTRVIISVEQQKSGRWDPEGRVASQSSDQAATTASLQSKSSSVSRSRQDNKHHDESNPREGIRKIVLFKMYGIRRQPDRRDGGPGSVYDEAQNILYHWRMCMIF